MAERRMFAKKVIESDAFLDMPLSAQALYFHLNCAADDDGFVNNPKRIRRSCGASEDDYKLLLMKNFIVSFESGIIVIKHWKIHNYIQKDRYKPTDYQDEMKLLTLKKSKEYELSTDLKEIPVMDTECIQDVSTVDTGCIQNVSVGKDRLGKDRLGKDRLGDTTSGVVEKPKPQKHKHGEYSHVLLTDAELSQLVEKYGQAETDEAIKYLDEYMEMKGKKYKSCYLALIKWVFDAVKEKRQKKSTVTKQQNLSPEEETAAWLKKWEEI
jgi:hypothetical protein